MQKNHSLLLKYVLNCHPIFLSFESNNPIVSIHRVREWTPYCNFVIVFVTFCKYICYPDKYILLARQNSFSLFFCKSFMAVLRSFLHTFQIIYITKYFYWDCIEFASSLHFTFFIIIFDTQLCWKRGWISK